MSKKIEKCPKKCPKNKKKYFSPGFKERRWQKHAIFIEIASREKAENAGKMPGKQVEKQTNIEKAFTTNQF